MKGATVHESWKTNKVSPTVALAHCLEKCSRLWHKKPGEASRLPVVRRWGWESWESK